MSSEDRLTTVVAMILVLVVAALAIFAVSVILGSGGPFVTPRPIAALAHEPTATPTPPPQAVPVPPDPATSAEVPLPIVDCGRIPPDACAQVIALARAGNEADLVGTTLIVMDDTCPPPAVCDRQFPFDTIVVFIAAGGDTTGWYAFHVFGLGNAPTDAEPWPDEIPAHIVDRIRAALAAP